MSLKEADRYIPHGGRCLGHKAGVRQVLQVFLFPAVMGSQVKKKRPPEDGDGVNASLFPVRTFLSLPRETIPGGTHPTKAVPRCNHPVASQSCQSCCFVIMSPA